MNEHKMYISILWPVISTGQKTTEIENKIKSVVFVFEIWGTKAVTTSNATSYAKFSSAFKLGSFKKISHFCVY